MRRHAVLRQDVLARSNVPSGVSIRKQRRPPSRSTDETPGQQGDEEKVGKGRRQGTGPRAPVDLGQSPVVSRDRNREGLCRTRQYGSSTPFPPVFSRPTRRLPPTPGHGPPTPSDLAVPFSRIYASSEP